MKIVNQFDHVTTGHISQYLKRKYDLKINCSKALIEAGFDLEKDENEPSLVYVKKATTRNKTSNRDQIQNKVEEKPLLFQFAYFPNFLNTLQELSNITQKDFGETEIIFYFLIYLNILSSFTKIKAILILLLIIKTKQKHALIQDCTAQVFFQYLHTLKSRKMEDIFLENFVLMEIEF